MKIITRLRKPTDRLTANLLSKSEISRMSCSELGTWCSQHTCKHCTRGFKTIFSKDHHEERCQVRIPEYFNFTKRVETTRVQEVLLEEESTENSDSESDISDTERTVLKEVKDTDPEISEESDQEFRDPANQICLSCGKGLKEVTMLNVSENKSGVELYKEEHRFAEDRLLEAGDLVTVNEFILFDEFNHIVIFVDNNKLISKDKKTFFNGLVKLLDCSYEVRRFGPINAWWTYVLQDTYYFGITTTSDVNYLLVEPSSEYFPYMIDPILRLDLVKATNLYHNASSPDHYLDFLQYLENYNSDLTEAFLRKHSQYLIKQIRDLDPDKTILDSRVMKVVKNLGQNGGAGGKARKRDVVVSSDGSVEEVEAPKRTKRLKKKRAVPKLECAEAFVPPRKQKRGRQAKKKRPNMETDVINITSDEEDEERLEHLKSRVIKAARKETSSDDDVVILSDF